MMKAEATAQQYDESQANGSAHEPACCCCGRARLDFECHADGSITVYFQEVDIEPEDDYQGWCREQLKAYVRWMERNPELAEDDDKTVLIAHTFQKALEQMGEDVGAKEPVIGPRQALEFYVSDVLKSARFRPATQPRASQRNREPRRRSTGARRARARSPSRSADGDDPPPRPPPPHVADPRLAGGPA